MNKIEFTAWKDLNGVMVEEINSLYTNIIFSGENNKVIGVLSSNENEGKTFVAMELLRAAANDGKKAILLDADFRKSRIKDEYGVENKEVTGIVSYLCGKAEYDEIICETNVENAHVILTDRYIPNPIRLLNSDKFSELIARLKEEYDFVIVDMPPVNLVIDGAIVAAKCDGVALVVQANATHFRMVTAAKHQLDKAGANILGVILNKAKRKMLNHYYGGKYYGGKNYGRGYYRHDKD
jgi:capsular exopolysaccharide synthesis family protein